MYIGVQDVWRTLGGSEMCDKVWHREEMSKLVKNSVTYFMDGLWLSERMNEWLKEWVNEGMNEWINESINKLMVSEWAIEWEGEGLTKHLI